MMQGRTILLAVLAALAPFAGCRKADPPTPEVAAANMYLQCVAEDLLSRPVLGLAGPGMCPGHFDIRASQVRRLRGCQLLLCLDFQKALGDKAAAVVGPSLRVVQVRPPGGLCEPPSYLACCRQVTEALVAADLLDRGAASQRLAEIDRRMADLSAWAAEQIASAALADTAVLASTHQEAFCRWLGLTVVGTFAGADTARRSEIDRAVQAGERARAALVIANLPEGRQSADKLAERLDAQVVVFENFPDAEDGRPFEDLVRRNVAALVRTQGR